MNHSLVSRRSVQAHRWIGLVMVVLVLSGGPLLAQITTTLTTEVITWNTVGLDSNNVSVGPNLYLVGVRACNTGAEDAIGVRADFVWDSSDPYINLQNGVDVLLVQDSFGFLDPNDPNDVAQSIIAAGECFDFYFNIEITRNSAAYDNTRDYHVVISADNATDVSTPANRELYVEHLVSQSRNKNVLIAGPDTIFVGGIFLFTMSAETATQGYEQIDAHITFPNTVFQVIAAETSYTAASAGVSNPVDSTYNDACGWIEDTTDPDYRECSGTGKAGNLLTQDYYVKIISLPPGSDPNDPNGVTLTLNGIIYDFSGSSYHYNSNFDSATFNFTVLPEPTSARFQGATATRRGSDVAIEWNTSREVDNLGFYVWREVYGKRTRVTPSLIAGSAIRAGPGLALPADENYRWFDSVAERSWPIYWIEAISITGTSEMFGPIVPTESVEPVVLPGTPGRAPLLADAGRSRPVSQWEQGAHELGAIVEPVSRPLSLSAANDLAQANQQEIAAGVAVKITVRADGWYRVTSAELLGAGLDPSTDTRGLRLFDNGEEVPCMVSDGGDGRLGSGDSIAFYGTGLDTPATDGHVYWLTAGTKPGARVESFSSKKSLPEVTASNFPFTVERKDRFLFFAALDNGDAESWFGPLVWATPTTQILQVSNLISSGGDASLEISLQGVTNDLGSQHDHRVRVELNGSYVGEMVFDGQELASRTFTVPASLLHDGNNTVTLGAATLANDISLVDRVRLTYPHAYAADSNLLRFSAAGLSSVTVGGFTSSDVRAVDITDPQLPIDLPAETSKVGTKWSAKVSIPGDGTRVVLMTTGASNRTAAKVAANSPSDWYDAKNGADLLIISHGSMIGAMAPLVSARSAQGWAVASIDVEDVYDEFSFGARDPAAIRGFLEHASTQWRVAPGYVLFVGDASVDPRNYLGFGDRDYVPTRFVKTAFNKVPSDEWFVDFDGDWVGELALGRLPARNAAEASVMVGKTLAYDSADTGDGWNARAVLVTDHNDPTGELNNFVAASDRLIPILDGPMTVETLYSDQMGLTAVRSGLLNRWNSGAGLINFYGHGSVQAWGRWNIFTNSNVAGLVNEDRLPVVTAMTCLTSFFHDVFSESMAEAMLRSSRGGAVAVWGSTGLTYLSSQKYPAEEFARQFVGEGLTIGDAIRAAKAAAFDKDVRRTWVLFGDPTLALRR